LFETLVLPRKARP